MKNTQKLFKLFLDTSVLLSGLNSPFGASAFILALFKLKKLIIVISPEVILEAEKVIETKFPLLKIPFLDFLSSGPMITKKLTAKEIKPAYRIINSEDAPILAGAIKGKVDFLITLDKKFLKTIKPFEKKIGFKVFTPKEFLEVFRRNL
jgi:putative PIN family toxin of toxin-antitoxin system